MDYVFDFTTLTAADALAIAALGEGTRGRQATAAEVLQLLRWFAPYTSTDVQRLSFAVMGDFLQQGATAFVAHMQTIAATSDPAVDATARRLLDQVNLDEDRA